jgi:hypothetical protein
VVQSTLAKWVLEEQLATLGIFQPGEGLEQHPELWYKFRNGKWWPRRIRANQEVGCRTDRPVRCSTVWADHADVVSKAYSGTGALKTDFTR